MNAFKTLMLGLALGIASSAFAQISTGNVYGTVKDEQGGVLPGATLVLSGPAGARTTTSSESGDFRFLNVSYGTYTLTASLDSFSTVEREVVVTTGQSVTLDVALRVAAMEETVLVSAETPVIDNKKMGTSTTLTTAELKSTPQARDPWAVLRTIPGVFVDRVNVAGSESGQQANFQGKGANTFDNSFIIEGVDVTDQGAPGSSPGYWDYDAFAEIAVTTGGGDFVEQTGAVNINFVTKRGTNRWRGSARGYLTHDDFQSSNVSGTELASDPRLGDSDKADHIDQIADYGFELGGPIIEDELFIWGSYGRQDIRLVTLNQVKDRTVLEGFNGKLNWQVTPNTLVTAFWFNSEKTKLGRDPGPGGIQNSEETVVDQGNRNAEFLPLDVPGLIKLELNHVFSPSFMVNVRYSNHDSGFGLESRNLQSPVTLDFVNGVARGGSWIQFGSIRPMKNITNVDGNYFTEGMGGQHELKFGFGYKKSEVTSTTTFGGEPGLLAWDFGPGAAYAWVTRQSFKEYETEFFNAYVADTFTKDRLTVTAGLRFDHQDFTTLPSATPANATFPDLLPGIQAEGDVGNGMDWNEVSPRVGVTYALDESRKTLARASFARYAGRIDSYYGGLENPAQFSYLAYLWDDVNGDGLPQGAEVRLGDGVQYSYNVDPANPGAATSPNRIDPDYTAPIDYELVFGLDREVAPDFAVSAAYTWRRITNVRNWDTRIGLTTADYVPNAPVTMNGYTARTFSPDPALLAATNSGVAKSNRPDYHQTYSGLELSLFKRLSNRWMARVAFTYADHTESLGPLAIGNPTRTDVSGGPGNFGLSGPQVDGGVVAPRSTGSGGGDIFYNAKWQLTANALYELPYGLEVAGSLYARQGYPRPIIMNLGAGGDGTLRTLAVPELDTEKHPDLWVVDFRLAKNLRFGGDRSISLSAELFNAFNSNSTLNQNRDASASVFNRIDRILAPRVARFGVVLSF
jgi:hypothetical protein